MRSTAHAAARPRYGVVDVVALLFRELLLMVVIFLVLFALGAAMAFTMKKTYTAGASLSTSCLMGVIRDDPRTREEFLRLVRA